MTNFIQKAIILKNKQEELERENEELIQMLGDMTESEYNNAMEEIENV